MKKEYLTPFLPSMFIHIKTSVRHIKTKSVWFLAKHIGGMNSLPLHNLLIANTLNDFHVLTLRT